MINIKKSTLIRITKTIKLIIISAVAFGLGSYLKLNYVIEDKSNETIKLVKAREFEKKTVTRPNNKKKSSQKTKKSDKVIENSGYNNSTSNKKPGQSNSNNNSNKKRPSKPKTNSCPTNYTYVFSSYSQAMAKRASLLEQGKSSVTYYTCGGKHYLIV